MIDSGSEKPTLLLVDDEEENLFVLSTLLEAEYRVPTAETVSRAFELPGPLAICRWFAQVHDGTIEVTRGSAGGALFEARLPLGVSVPPGGSTR